MDNWVRMKHQLVSFLSVSSLGLDWEELLIPYLELGGAQSVGVVGTCFGSYIVIHTSASFAPFMSGGVSIHPSHPGMECSTTYLSALLQFFVRFDATCW